jgi:transcriptional regulator with XRE-family HTH domain
MAAADLGKRVRDLRKKLGMSQAQFAKELGVTKLSVVRYEAGQLPRVAVLDRIARRAGVSMNWLLHGSDEQSPPVSKLTPAEALITVIAPESFAKIALLPAKYRTRYQRWSNELLGRLQRDLEEYADLLQGHFKRPKGRKRR